MKLVMAPLGRTAGALDEVFEAPDGTQMLRESNTQTPNGNPIAGRWVLRDLTGTMLDFDRYRHDLLERNGYHTAY